MEKNKFLTFGIYLYTALPFLIFAGGFLKWYFAIPAVIITFASVILSAKASNSMVSLAIEKFDIIKIIFAILFITAMVLLSGIGNVLWQNNDHATRNTIFEILSTYSWPPEETTKAGYVGLVYYIGFWLPAALVSKITTVAAGYIFQVIWAVLGLLILWYLLCVMHKKIVIYPLVIFLFFSGLDVFGHRIVELIFSDLTKLQIGRWAFAQGSSFSSHIEWWPRYFQYSSHTTQLFWVFNQCLPVWISTILLLNEKNNKNLVFIMGTTLLSSTLPFIGLIPIFIWCAVCRHDDSLLNRRFTDNIKESFFSLFTFQNVLGGGITGILSFLYLRSNVASGQSGTAASKTAAYFSFPLFLAIVLTAALLYFILSCKKGFNPINLFYLVPVLPFAFLISQLTKAKLIYYLLFVVFEFLIFALLIMPAHGKSTLFYITTAALFIIPFFKVGKSIDFCMRASIPLLVVLSLFAISALDKYFESNRRLLALLLCTALMLGSVTPLHEICRTAEATAFEIRTKGKVVNDSKTIEHVFSGRNFTGETKGDLFFEIFAKENEK